MTLTTFIFICVLGATGMLMTYLIGREQMAREFEKLDVEWHEDVLKFRKERVTDILQHHEDLKRILIRHNFTTAQRPFKVINGNKNTSPTILDLTQNFTNQEYYH